METERWFAAAEACGISLPFAAVMRSFLRSIAVLVAVVLAAAGPASALENGLARTPPMGWNSWRHFGCNISEALIRQTADAMVASGMRDAGYAYVVVDAAGKERATATE